MMTHAQAQQRIHSLLDGRDMAENEWMALQCHLEACADCRNYQHSLQSLEAQLRRGLRQEAAGLWPGLNGPREDAVPHAIGWLRGSALRHKMAGLAWAAGALILLLALILGGGMLAPTLMPARLMTETPTAPAPSPTPASLAGFQGQVAYETRQDGNAEIYLLNAGGAPANITHNPADDTEPSWSPDGEWLAFLSNRTGKAEVYVMHISGSRLTQLSDLPDVDWQGPISWAGDGSRLALIGQDRANGGQSWVYLVPVNDNTGQPIRVGYTRGARQVKFSPGRLWLAYQNGMGGPDSILLYDLDQAQYMPVDPAQKAGMHLGDGGQFDWSADGRSLVYLNAGPFNGDTPAADASSKINTVLELRIQPSVMSESLASTAVAFGPDASTFRSVSWSVWASHVAYLKDTGDDCWVLHLSGAAYPWEQPIQVPGLCITAGLERANWLFNPAEAWQGWLVVTGHEPGSQEMGLYALRVANPNNSGGESIPPRVMRLLPGAEITGAPRLRPAFSAGLMLVTIDPQPAAPPQSFPAPVAIPGDLPGRLLLSRSSDGMVTLRPDGQERQVFDQPVGRETSCPTWSPDGTRMAFLSDQESNTRRVNEIFLMDADGGNLQRLTQPHFPVDVMQDNPQAYPTPRYQCPVWSPDGQSLAAVVNTREAAYVAFVPVDGIPARYIHVPNPSYWRMIWTPDSRGVLLGAALKLQESAYSNTSLIFIDPAQISDDDQGTSIQILYEADHLNDLYDLTFSPDGRQIAFIGLTYGQTYVTGALYLADMPEIIGVAGTLVSPRKVLDMPNFQPRYNTQGLRWVPDGSLLFFVPQGTNQAVKSEIWRYDPQSGQQTTLAQFSEIVLSTAWSSEDGWVAYSAESGLYLLNLEAAGSGQAGPARLGDDASLDLDWK